MKLYSIILILGLSTGLSSCEFNCSVGKKKEITGAAKLENGTRLYNNIQLRAQGVKVEKAFLLLEDGQRVPDDNFVDFTQPIRVELEIDKGWTEEKGKVFLGASEKIMTEDSAVILNDEDLFAQYADGLSPADVKAIYLTATLHLKRNAPPTSFIVSFRVWDKRSDKFVEGSYKLYSR